MMNNPYHGGTHLPDVTVITPVFDSGGKDILSAVASRGHHADIGGSAPGSAPPDSKHIDDEGVLIEDFYLVRDGRVRKEETRELLSSGRYPYRNVDQNMADLAAQVAANATGVRELHNIVSKFSRDVVHGYMKHVQDKAEECVRRALDDSQAASSPTSSTAVRSFVSPSESIARNAPLPSILLGHRPRTRATTTRHWPSARQLSSTYSEPSWGSDIPMNEGCLKPMSVHAPEGTLINPRYPAAVIADNTEVSQAITEALYGALGVLAGSQVR